MSLAQNSNLDSKRRRFQPPITTFFSPAVSDSNGTDAACSPHLSHNHYAAATHSPTPIVPAKIQSSLLSVGMRVRKSVAEGYKTKGVKMFDTPTSTISLSAKHEHSTGRGFPTVRGELAPFCGLSKSCDYTVEPHSNTVYELSETRGYNVDIVTDDGDAFSLPPSSQESVYSANNGQKRSYDPYADEDASDFEHSVFVTTDTVPGRTILCPSLGRQRRRFVALQSQAIQQGTMQVDDFEEPVFLRRREEVDADYMPARMGDCEVKMGGA
ncbi:hypothetical protein KXW98_006625 [Aspergillus fumigatus]|jgi:hypothetical protein|uniref:Uncharacterized protein n=3 Tax=Aspergillus fumigatus TaxID=746128 RepID=Q4WRU7_ASPFU|nr:conserved hypothetical protein [Aspergillus fumigatus Af293]EDP56741.1 conserved hypothetical protein [Aspergillus fumigatus A1163]KAF4266647.1 hypothetical protein CNMCM8714_004854 [Aspergillus fumigatus]KMK55686.1 hypothetical protein Y699_09120 [Aspergillus fumigatus Z5]EAL90835.1 conserved hypothetical protein [Aspergillus fumigatus Af293]KAF4273744.1 hypothetical protein CNMCM8057_005579 [Aspergillus fumigatus]